MSRHFSDTVQLTENQWSKGQGLTDKSGKEIEVTNSLYYFLYYSYMYREAQKTCYALIQYNSKYIKSVTLK